MFEPSVTSSPRVVPVGVEAIVTLDSEAAEPVEDGTDSDVFAADGVDDAEATSTATVALVLSGSAAGAPAIVVGSPPLLVPTAEFVAPVVTVCVAELGLDAVGTEVVVSGAVDAQAE